MVTGPMHADKDRMITESEEQRPEFAPSPIIRSAHSQRLIAIILAAVLSVTSGFMVPAIKQDQRVLASAEQHFPIGVFEDANQIDTAERFEDLINDLQSRGMDTVLFTNNFVTTQAPLLDISDRLGFNVIFAPIGDLDRRWWSESVSTDIETARSVIGPIVDRLSGHPSVRGYSIVDEPDVSLLDKVALAVRAFRERDPSRPAMPVLVGLDRGDQIFNAARPDVMLIDVYPIGKSNGPCDLQMTGFGYPGLDFVEYVRAMTRSKPAGVPLWFVLQTHGVDWANLREPSPAEIRLQHWLAIGEGAKGIFWFTYSTQQGWRGLEDNARLYTEATALAGRIRPHRETLLRLRKGPNTFVVGGASGAAYVSTLVNPDDGRLYAVVANRDCTGEREVSILGPDRAASLVDLESGQTLAIGSPIKLGSGDGRIFELKPSTNRRTTSLGELLQLPRASAQGVPPFSVNYDEDVESFWARHWANPASPSHVARIPAPEPRVTVRPGGLQAAIDGLPADGGTLYLLNGTYERADIIGRSNVHLRGESRAGVRLAGLRIASCPESIRYTTFNLALANREASAVECAAYRRGNISIATLTFDGQDALVSSVPVEDHWYTNNALMMRTIRDVVIEDVSIQNYRSDKSNPHMGIIAGNFLVDGIWGRDLEFGPWDGVQWFFDGCHGCGLLRSTVRFAGSGSIVYFVNDDATDDRYPEDGVYEPHELRLSNYTVLEDNVIDHNNAFAINHQGARALIRRNRTTGFHQVFALLATRANLNHPGDYSYRHYGHRVYENQIQEAFNLIRWIGWRGCSGQDDGACPLYGDYVVRDNRVVSKNRFVAMIEKENFEPGYAEEPPVVVEANTVAGN
jgi:hypothetical protein